MTEVMKDSKETPLPKILKLGQSIITGYDQTTNGIFGDIRYRAPEVLRGKAYDFRADIWSFGVILFYILSGGVYPYDYLPQDMKRYNGQSNRPSSPIHFDEAQEELVRSKLER